MPNLFGKSYTKRELLDHVGDMSQLAGVRRAELVEGNERGADLIEVFNASGLSFSVLPGRALDIASAHYKGMSLCFRGNTGDVGPAFYEPQGYGWMRGFFGGLLTSCGMTFVGHPEVDPEEENVELGLHGRLANIPAKGVLAEGAWDGDEYVVRVRGKMREAEVFATNLELTREISTVLGERSLRITDRIENLSVDPSPLMMVYHTNPGFPILDAGTRLVFKSKKSTEWLEDQEVGPDEYTVVQPPQKDAHDDVYVHRPIADANGNVNVGLINDRLKLGLYWTFPISEIPILNQWQHFHRGTYVTGIEPGNCSVLGRAWNRKHETLQHIQPDEVREFHLEIGVLDGEEEIAAFEQKVGSG
ncbi:aldose 1-epimerase family protein [Chloroflexi bacterium TSY]|nr:aldose 1-epimerase family protein [Chloroflexi bacterium TSY]